MPFSLKIVTYLASTQVFFFRNVTSRESSAHMADNACLPFVLKEIRRVCSFEKGCLFHMWQIILTKLHPLTEMGARNRSTH